MKRADILKLIASAKTGPETEFHLAELRQYDLNSTDTLISNITESKNNKSIAEYRVFNQSMREMQIQTSNFEQACQVWSDGVAATGECWTLLIMPANNGKKQYLQTEGSINDYRMSLITDFHGDFKSLDEKARDEIINPAHYQVIPSGTYPQGLEYMDLMTYILAHHNGVESHLLGQILKYSIRIGKKDDKLQDAKKIQWYANYLVTIIEQEDGV
jgi:hypothetical protein